MEQYVIDRFHSKYVKADGCWEWTAGKQHGYGHFKVPIPPSERLDAARQTKWQAHRLAWEIHVGPIPDGLFVLHSCDNPGCVNPDHLFLGTQADNMDDCKAKGRKAVGAGHGNSNLTEQEVLSIRREYSGGGISKAALGRKYGIGTPGVRKIIKRENWAHV